MSTSSSKELSREELVAMFQASRVSKPKKANTSSGPEVLTYFPKLNKLIGKYEHQTLPVEIVITKIAMFDKRSMTVLFALEDVDGNPLPMGIFNPCPTGRELEDKKHISLGSLTDHLKMDEESSKIIDEVLAHLNALMEKAVELDQVKRGYASAANFQKYYQACFPTA